MIWTETDQDLLLRLLRIPTAGPLEPGDSPAPALREAQLAYAQAAAALGLEVVRHAPASAADIAGRDIPLTVSRAAAAVPGFLASQPSMVLRLGPPLPSAATVMFNVHLDTVAGGPRPAAVRGRITGRGAIDAKGPAVALLAGVRAAIAAQPLLGTSVGVLIQAVAGEEGGAMGSIGTRPLVRLGYTGRLNLFCEPTGLRYLPRATAAATARVYVKGRDSVDDRPGQGHNATVLLGFIAQHLAGELSSVASRERRGDRACVAGLSTGLAHNKVYGSGQLLVNLPYARAADGARAERALEDAVRSGVELFARRFAPLEEYALTAADAAAITRVEWLKRGLPALVSADPEMEAVLTGADLARWPDDEPAFTCDAIWMDGLPGAYTAVFGPGDLAANQAHAPGEFATVSELDEFAAGICRILLGFTAHRMRNQGIAMNGAQCLS
jgi:acetylornithine deacetylase/succinyl-diaminopimelate desuccinylase-like protein